MDKPRRRQSSVRRALRPFSPGDGSRYVRPAAWGGKIREAEPGLPGTVCDAEVPSRLHASVLDMNRFEIGYPGGGGIGFGLALFCRARVVLTEGTALETGGAQPAMARHLAELFRELAGYRGGLEIEVQDHGHRHLGLGSSIGTLTATAVALNEALGRPLALRDLRKLVAFNYCEEAPGDPRTLVPGFETNVGAMVAVHGGMVLASDRCELVSRIPLPPSMRALLVLPRIAPGATSGHAEAEALLHRARELDETDAHRKTYRVLMDLLPAMYRGDLEGIGDVVYELACLGSKRAECGLHGTDGREIYAVLDRLRAEGTEIASMSSVGPAVFALSRRPEVWERWRAWAGEAVGTRTLEVPVDSTGARVRLDGVAVPYRLEPWWTEPVYPVSARDRGRPPDGLPQHVPSLGPG